MPIEVSTGDRVDLRVITDEVSESIPAGTDGTLHVFITHSTAGLMIEHDGAGLFEYYEEVVSRLVPRNVGDRHFDVHKNADSHLRAMLIGPSVTVPVRDGEIALGGWQEIILFEFDGPREREIHVTIADAATPLE
jgi:secondary thiamine-phosphate synthase enzyme